MAQNTDANAAITVRLSPRHRERLRGFAGRLTRLAPDSAGTEERAAEILLALALSRVKLEGIDPDEVRRLTDELDDR